MSSGRLISAACSMFAAAAVTVRRYHRHQAEPFTHRHREQFGEADSSRQRLRERPRRQKTCGTGEQVLASDIGLVEFDLQVH